MKRTILFSVAVVMCFAISGCGGNDCAVSNAPAPAAPGASQDKASESSAPVEPASADESQEPLSVDDANSPEGVVDAFFRSFFKGDDDGSFALLTEKAQKATVDNFSAQASDTIKWKITRKTAPENGRVYVFVDVEDYTDSGEIQTEELTFALSDADSDAAWRVAGFSVGGVAINFEDRQINAVAQETVAEPREAETNVKVGQNADGVVR